MPRSTADVPLLTAARDVQAWCDRTRLHPQDGVALDTEFVPEKRYAPLLCLVQLATRHEIVLIDALEVPDLRPLRAVFAEVEVVVHAGEQDLKLLGEAMQGTFTHVFDTQIAAALLGPKEQIGYVDAVAERLGVQLDKGDTLSHWDRRPLSTQQLRYAAADVRHLLPLYDAQKEDLAARGRLTWAYEEFQRILGVAGSSREEEDEEPNGKGNGYRRLPQAWRLTRQQLAVLKAAWDWRDARAARSDALPKRIMGDHTLMRIATSCPTDEESLKAIRGIPRGMPEEQFESLLRGIRKVLAQSPERWPALVGSPHLSPEMRTHLDVLQVLVRHIAQQEDIAPGLLAQTSLLKPYLTQSFRTREAFDGVAALTGWRAEILADALWDWLSGNLDIHFSPDKRGGPGRVAVSRRGRAR